MVETSLFTGSLSVAVAPALKALGTGQQGDGIHGMEMYLGSIHNLHVTLRKREEVHERKAA